MIYNAIDGTTLAVTQEFLDDFDNPVIPKPGYPKVKLVDKTKAILSSTVGAPSTTPGEWNANIPIPTMGVEERQELRVIWILKDTLNYLYKVTDTVLVEPKTDYRFSDIVSFVDDPTFNVVLPMHFGAGDQGRYQIYQGNDAVLPSHGDLSVVPAIQSMDKTTFTIVHPVETPSLVASLLKVDITPNSGDPRSFNYKLWTVTPSIMLGATHLEDFLNKSRIENVIPELRYNTSDLLGYLERGLYLFNTLGQPTYFTGTNMKGVLFDCWLTCSCYYAISAQLLAEGSLAFDFSGQGISLNVDRTPQLDSAIGRIESALNDRIVPFKAKMVKQGIRGGDGAVGAGNLNNPANHGVVGIINAPTTTVPFGLPVYMGRRGFR